MTQKSDDGSHDAPVELICVIAEHIAMGQKLADGQGTLTVVARRWAYCTAGLLNAEHKWQETGGVAFDSIRHADVSP